MFGVIEFALYATFSYVAVGFMLWRIITARPMEPWSIVICIFGLICTIIIAGQSDRIILTETWTAHNVTDSGYIGPGSFQSVNMTISPVEPQWNLTIPDAGTEYAVQETRIQHANAWSLIHYAFAMFLTMNILVGAVQSMGMGVRFPR